ncbi:DUF3889 domain-containing protein [Alicyclobacillus macrosporangiidus]|uniref:DUF3889 domain-containing protein n=1 Tax=Alicyclobacillus macrosporangiidus TaxID=392015 RepID=A0A1I7HXV9_9BACL|nr:DUF3889 domain-containing protein [Alicyclobacillus macrosporangiidus]SFU65520.1 Protein of unknown function [Alicyclobacillus macrosporangiidus]
MPLDDDRRGRVRRAVCLALGAALVAAVPQIGTVQAESVGPDPAEASRVVQAESASSGLARGAWATQAEPASSGPAGPSRATKPATTQPAAASEPLALAASTPRSLAAPAPAVPAQPVLLATAAPQAQAPQPGSRAPTKPAQRPNVKPEPAYAPWGRMAMRIVQNRYPKAAIVDYLHVGRRNLSATRAQETFKLWLRQGKQEFGVYVTITFNTQTQRVLRTDLRRTVR